MIRKTNLKTAVFLCADLETLGRGLDLRELQRWLQESVPEVCIQVMHDLGKRPEEITGAVAAYGAERLVLGLCHGEYSRAEVQVQVRKAGLDPLGIEAVNLGVYAGLSHHRQRAMERAKILLTAAVARARAFPGSWPENVKPCLSGNLSRRSLLSLSLMEYQPVPSIRGSYCVAGSGCDSCVQACPCGALEKVGARIRLDKSRCDACGLCVTECPREAVRFPGHTPNQIAAQITTLLDPNVGGLQSRGILLTCQRSALILENLATKGPPGADSRSQISNSGVELLPVQVPCLGMVPPTWLLGWLTMGASAVGLFPCPGRCPFDQKEVIESRVAYCREVLRVVGGSSERIRLLQLEDERIDFFTFSMDAGLATWEPERRIWNPSPAQTLLQLAQDYQVPEGVFLDHPHSPLGLVEVTDGCTGCGVCATACPTDALTLERRDVDLSLTFDAALCTACGLCLRKCPEAEKQVLHLKRITDFRRLSQGRVALYEDQYVRCEACDAPFAPESMLMRMEAMIGDETAPAVSAMARYCPRCRGGFGTEPVGLRGRGAERQ